MTSLCSHKYQQLPLIPVEEFLHTHPEHNTAQENDDGDGDGEKKLMFARINHELSVRETLEHERQGLLKKKQGLIADNKKRKDDLASLDKDLETFIDVRDPFPFPIAVLFFRYFSRKPQRINPFESVDRSC